VVLPLWNQWPVTLAFFESLVDAEPQLPLRLVAVDNGSRDATAKGLRAWSRRLPLQVIRNARNRGVAPAWNQGLRAALKGGARWVGILNNDLLLGPQALSRLVEDAEAEGWDAVSPATREGALGYDLQRYAAAYTRRCAGWRREGAWFGWCFLASRRAFATVGHFDEGFELGIGEDEDFFRRLQGAGLRCGVSGRAFVHHFGSATLGPLRREQGKAFEERNLARLRERWRIRRPGLAQRWGVGLQRAWDWLRWGHLLKE
jgi:GT2 family glycosyltransferase